MSLLNIDKNYLHNLGITDEDLIESGDYDSDFLEDQRELKELKKKEEPRQNHPTKINKLEIKPLYTNDEAYAEAPNEFLFKPPFSLLFVGIKGAGKTTALSSILSPYSNYFDEVFVFSPTAKLDISFKKMAEILKIDNKNIFSKYTETRLKKLMKKIKQQNKNVPQKEKLRTLIIFEDVIAQLKHTGKSALDALAFNSRHYNVSYCILSQYFKKLPPTHRNNATGWVLYNMENQFERKKITQELSGSLGADYFEELYGDVTSEPYQALTINYQNTHPYRYTKNFNEVITDD